MIAHDIVPYKVTGGTVGTTKEKRQLTTKGRRKRWPPVLVSNERN
jgi:hypothetical protein